MQYVIAIILVLIVAFFALCIYCYRYAFKTSVKRQSKEHDVPPSPYKEKIIDNINSLLIKPFESVETMSFDGLRLRGRYYEIGPDAPIAVIMHGYRSNYCRDGNGGFKICSEYGLNVLLPDQRAHGKSEGKTITFGVKERYDCLSWVNYILNRFGKDTKIILVGLSMGASTVMMASDLAPQNVKGIISDCGFSSPKEILTEVARQMHLPAKAAYFFTRLSARVFGSFDPESSSATKSLKNTNIPTLFIHGEDDDYVPCHMSRLCFDACNSEKYILTVPKASHGMSYYIDTKGYTDTVNKFLNNVLNYGM